MKSTVTRDAGALAVICVLIAVCYGQTLNHAFFWDTHHLFKYPELREFSLETLVWVFTNAVNTNWHPITMATHALDYSLFGSDPRGHHLVNLLLHCLVSIALFYCIKELLYRGREDREKEQSIFLLAALTTLFFALHPQRVEVVAWVSARKDLLYALFYLLAVISYVRFTRDDRHRVKCYVASLSLFALSLLSKSMAVTLPALLLLLDVYPLHRLNRASLVRCLLEKLPFIMLSALVVLVTLLSQAEAMAGERMAFADQLRNMIHNLTFYLQKALVPLKLSPFYPFPSPAEFYAVSYWLPSLLFVAANLVLGVLLWVRGRPLLIACWAAYLVMLSPASGIIQVGSAAAADRYTYLPLVPFALLAALAIVYTWDQLPRLRRVMTLVVVLSTVTLVGLTTMQTRHWLSPITLWSHTLRIYPDAGLPHKNIASVYAAIGYFDDALEHLHFLAGEGWPVAEDLAELYLVSGRVAEGEASSRQVLEQLPAGSPALQVYRELLALLQKPGK